MAAVDHISADFLHGLKEHTWGRWAAPLTASGYDRSISTINFPAIPRSWRAPTYNHEEELPTGQNAIEKAENMPDTQVDIEASVNLPDTQVALDVALEDDRQAILACAHAIGGCTRACGYNRLFQISSCASPPPTTRHARCARNLEASQTQCDDPDLTLPRNLEAALDEEATSLWPAASAAAYPPVQEAHLACACRFAALLDIAVTTAIGITGSWQYTNPLSI